VEEGEVGLGVSEPTGPTSAALTFSNQGPSEQGGGSLTIRATIEVAPDGQSLTADYTVEVSGVEGVPPGEYGPGSVTGTRVVVEPMGTPVGSLESSSAPSRRAPRAPRWRRPLRWRHHRPLRSCRAATGDRRRRSHLGDTTDVVADTRRRRRTGDVHDDVPAHGVVEHSRKRRTRLAQGDDGG
jgi:hypothetical protein